MAKGDVVQGSRDVHYSKSVGVENSSIERYVKSQSNTYINSERIRCPNCGNDVTQRTLIECNHCGEIYCNTCEIEDIACPKCGTPYYPLDKMECSLCNGNYSIKNKDRLRIEKLDEDMINSVKQRVVCPICNHMVFYSSENGQIYVKEYTPDDILSDYKLNNFIYTPINEYLANFKGKRG